MRTGHLAGLGMASSPGALPVSGVPRQVTALTSWTASDRLSGQANTSQSWPTWQARLQYAGKGTQRHWPPWLACNVHGMEEEGHRSTENMAGRSTDIWQLTRQCSLSMATRR